MTPKRSKFVIVFVLGFRIFASESRQINILEVKVRKSQIFKDKIFCSIYYYPVASEVITLDDRRFGQSGICNEEIASDLRTP